MGRRLALILGMLVGSTTGCGDDDGATTPSDAAMEAAPPADARPDMARDTGSPARDMGMPPRDMGMPPDDMATPPPVDAGPAPDVMRDCDPFSDPCATGEKCTVAIDVDAMDMQSAYTRCAPEGTRTVGGRCSFAESEPTPDGTRTFLDNCERGSFCGTLPGRRFSTCLPFCSTGADCGDTELCLGVDPSVDIGLCMEQPVCDPLQQTGCSGGQGCYIVSDGHRVLPSCAPYVAEESGGDGSFDEPCSFVNNCRAGLNCSPGADGETGRCRSLCDPMATGVGGPMSDGGVDAGPPADAGTGSDAGADAATPADAGPMDAAPSDGGPGEDAGPGPTVSCPVGEGTCMVQVDEGVVVPLDPPVGLCL